MSPLYFHSNYSLLQGTIPVEDVVVRAKKAGSSYASLTDTNGMYGLVRFAKLAQEAKIKPVLGVYVDDPKNKNQSAVLLAKNNEGYSELCKIITSRKLKDDFPLAELLRNISPNLFVVTSSFELLKNGDISRNVDENLFVELIVTERQKRKTRELFNFARENKLKIVASHPVYFAKKEDYLLHKTVTAIRLNSTLANLDEAELVDEEFYWKSPDELKEIWKALPEALWNVEHIVQNCTVDLGLGKYKHPAYPLPPGETSFSYLWKLAFKGLEELYWPITDRVIKRLQYELEVIDELCFCDYFLVVWDIVKQAKSRRMMMVGRGSAANSLVAYCLGFTQVDPIKYNLDFERFLNRARKSPPDVDLDFSWRERDELVRYVYEKFGYNKVAMISTTVTFRARSAFREVAKVFGIPDSEISKYSKFIPWTKAKNLPELAEKFPESKSLHFKSEPWRTIVNIAAKLSSFPRHLSIHSSGLVITNKPITNYVALEYAKNKGLGLIITQPDMYSIEDLGLIKIDLLSQRALGVLRETVDIIKKQMPAENQNTPRIFQIRN